MISMTGHGRGVHRMAGWTAVVECSSVNRKNAEVVVHCDRIHATLEPAVRERVLKRVGRGRVQVNLSLERNTSPAGPVLDIARARRFVREARALQETLKLDGPLSIADVLAAPGVVRSEPRGTEGAEACVWPALDRALDGLVATRRREGQALRVVLQTSSRKLRSIAQKILPLTKTASRTLRKSLGKKMRAAGADLPQNDPRLLAEAALLAERADVAEEIARISSHLYQFNEGVRSKVPVGRTLEFLAQELGREFHTLGSKSSDIQIARLVIDAKTEIDRIREQVANVE